MEFGNSRMSNRFYRIPYLLDDRVKGFTSERYLADFMSWTVLSEDEIAARQIKKLNKLLKIAIDIPFWSERFSNSGFKPEVKCLSDLTKLPPLTRMDLQENYHRMTLSSHGVKVYHGSSSGSTGTPVHYYHDQNGASAGKAAGRLQWIMGGWSYAHKGLHIWGNPSVANNEWKRFSSRCKAKLLRHHKFAAYQITQGDRLDDLCRLIIKEKYDYLDGYTNAIHILAEHLKMRDVKLPSVKYILTTGENLHAYQKDAIEANIAPVFDMYGCGEINGIAGQCKLCGQYHILDPHVIVEFGPAIAENSIRKLLITDLDNHYMPMIRYENGDAGIRGESKKCKIGFSSLKGISGRTSDIIRLSNGGSLSVPSFFGSVLLREINSIKQYQVVKTDSNKLVIKLVLSRPLGLDERDLIEMSMASYLGDSIDWEIRIVEGIELGKSGKFKLVVDESHGVID